MRKSIFLFYFSAVINCTVLYGKPVIIPAAKVVAGIEVGAKGVKFILLDIVSKEKTEGSYRILKDSTVNTDFISFTEASLQQTCAAMTGLYRLAKNEYKLPASKILTIISSGVQQSAVYNKKIEFIDRLNTIFTALINEPERNVAIISAEEESEFSMLGAVSENILTETFLLDIGSGNTKGGFFNETYYNEPEPEFAPGFISWGTKSTGNEVSKKAGAGAESFVSAMDMLFQQTINPAVKELVTSRAGLTEKANNFIGGGIAWAIMNCMLAGKTAEDGFLKIELATVTSLRERMRLAYLAGRLNAGFFTATVADAKQKENFTSQMNEVFRVYNEKDLVCGMELVYTILYQLRAEGCNGLFFLTTKGKYGWLPGYILSRYH
jgi:hypothetical protein